MEVIDPKIINADGMRVAYKGLPLWDGVAVLTAANGYFARNFTSQGRCTNPVQLAEDRGFIKGSFSELAYKGWTSGTARWHLWFTKTGKVDVDVHYRYAGATNLSWRLTVGDQSREFTTADTNEEYTRISVPFVVQKAGKVSVILQPLAETPQRVTFRNLELHGPAMEGVKRLRVYYRPHAVHAKFFPPKDCRQCTMWVFESKSDMPAKSFSPITTPFGYFGGGFSGKRVTNGMNFSVWPGSSMLIASGYSKARFGGFNHEGTGVKLRSVGPYDHMDPMPETAIQALRVEGTGRYVTYYGYVFDEGQDRWRLYGSVMVPRKGGATGGGAGVGWAGSFCEVPGMPAGQRTGDEVRKIKRRGWFYSAETKQFYAAGRRPGKGDRKWVDSPQELPGIPRRSVGLNKYVAYDDEGWCVQMTGGIECYSYTDYRVKDGATGDAAASDPISWPLPHYLQPDKVKQLFELPIEIGESSVVEVSAERGQAAIAYDLKKLGPNARAKLFYGTRDAGTTARDPEINGSGAFKAGVVDTGQAVWESVKEQTVSVGENRFHLTGLKRDTTYYFRLFVAHDQGKSWDYQSGEFATQ